MRNNYLRTLILTLVGVCCPFAALYAQSDENKGHLSGSFETNTIWYIPDKVVTPNDRFGSNNYLKLDYSRGNFSAGFQYELYAPVLQGFNQNLKGGKITNKFAAWSDGKFNVTVGDFFEQFGNGLVLRSYEDRALGFNNSLEGVRAGFNNDLIAVKAIWARPRLNMEYADTWVRGADMSLSLTSLLKMDRHFLAVEGSYVNRYEAVSSPDHPAGPNMNLWSGRLVFDADWGFSARGEYVDKGAAAYLNMTTGTYEAKRGNAQLLELSYNNSGLGIFLTGRRLDHMAVKISEGNEGATEIDVLNYLPALIRQYPYSLATLEPYSTETDGEQGGQIDVFYTFARGTALGGKYGTKLHANASTFYPLEKKGRKMNAFYRDISFDIEKQWNRKLKTTFMYAVQTFSPDHAVTGTTWVNNVFVADILYKFTTRNSVRLELQYLYCDDPRPVKEQSDWMAALVEVNFAPNWSFFVSDMYNHGGEKVHYYSAGMSYSKSRTRVALSYGRNRAGYVCSGGVCRYMPAYTGANIAITTSF